MTVFVSVGDPAAELAALLDHAPAKDRSPSDTIAQMLTPACIDGLLGGDAARAKTAFTIAFSTLGAMNVQDIAKLSDRVTSSSCQSATDAADLRLWAMVSLFNAVQVDSIKSRVLSALLQYVLDAGLTRALQPSLSCVDQWLQEWSLDDLPKARLLSLTAAVHDACDACDDAQAQRLRILAIRTDDKALRELQAEVASQSVAHVFKHGKIAAMDSLLTTITARNVSSPLVDLLGLMRSGSLPDLDAFCARHAAVLDRAGVVPDRARFCLRALILCGLASERKALSLKDDIQPSLALGSIDDAEQVFIDAVSMGLINGRIDENEGRVYLTSCMYRSLNDAVWRDLQQRLQTWRDSIGTVLPWSQHVPS